MLMKPKTKSQKEKERKMKEVKIRSLDKDLPFCGERLYTVNHDLLILMSSKYEPDDHAYSIWVKPLPVLRDRNTKFVYTGFEPVSVSELAGCSSLILPQFRRVLNSITRDDSGEYCIDGGLKILTRYNGFCTYRMRCTILDESKNVSVIRRNNPDTPSDEWINMDGTKAVEVAKVFDFVSDHRHDLRKFVDKYFAFNKTCGLICEYVESARHSKFYKFSGYISNYFGIKAVIHRHDSGAVLSVEVYALYRQIHTLEDKGDWTAGIYIPHDNKLTFSCSTFMEAIGVLIDIVRGAKIAYAHVGSTHIIELLWSNLGRYYLDTIHHILYTINTEKESAGIEFFVEQSTNSCKCERISSQYINLYKLSDSMFKLPGDMDIDVGEAIIGNHTVGVVYMPVSIGEYSGYGILEKFI